MKAHYVKISYWGEKQYRPCELLNFENGYSGWYYNAHVVDSQSGEHFTLPKERLWLSPTPPPKDEKLTVDERIEVARKRIHESIDSPYPSPSGLVRMRNNLGIMPYYNQYDPCTSFIGLEQREPYWAQLSKYYI